METGELTGGDIALIAASVSAGSAIITAIVTSMFTHWSASNREIRARNSERLAELSVEFLREFRVFQRYFADWSMAQEQATKMHISVLSNNERNDDSEKKLDFLMADATEKLECFKKVSDELGTYHSALEIYAPNSVREAYQSAYSSVTRALKVSLDRDENISEIMVDISREFERSRASIAKAVRRELSVKSRRDWFKWFRRSAA